MEFTEIQLQILQWVVVILVCCAALLCVSLAVGIAKFTYEVWFN